MQKHNFVFIFIAALFSLVAFSSTPAAAQSQAPVPYATPAYPTQYPGQYPGQVQKVKIVKKVAVVKPSPTPFVDLVMTLAHSRSLYDHKDGSLAETNDMEFAPTFNWSKAYKTQVYIAYSQDTKNYAASDSTDLMLITSHKSYEMGVFDFTPALIGVVPASKDSTQNRHLYGGLGGKMTLGLQEKYLLTGFYLRGALTGFRNAYRYEIADDGTSSNAYASRQIFMTGYSYGIFALDFEFDHVNAWTYSGQLKEKFEHITEATANLTDHWGFTLGHTNSGSVFKPNGTETNLKYIDENNSLVYAKVVMQY